MRTVGNKYILIIDLLSLIIGGYGMLHISNMKLPDHLKSAGPWQFLTNLSLCFSLLIFLLGFLSHLFKNEKLFKLKNFLHLYGFVAEIIVFSVYWPLRLFFLKLLVKNVDDFSISLILDLSIHLMPILSLSIDFFLFMPIWTVSINLALFGCISLTTSYWIWLHYLIDFENGGEFPYAFLNVENDILRGIIFTLVGSLAFANFILMKFLYKKFVKQEQKENIKKLQ